MKQTNNAIKFLMAQYRAIFQNAYFKGLATAAVVTAGLAAGQAQAANAFTGATTPTSGTTVFIDGTANSEATHTKFDAITITEDKSLPNLNIEISKGAPTTANKVETGSKANATLTINNLTIKGDDENVGLSLVGVAGSGDAFLKANAINIETGTLKTTLATAHVGKIEAKSITIGKASLAAGKAVLDLDDTSYAGNTINNDRTKNTDITLNAGALIKAAAKATAGESAVKLNADTLSIKAGEIQTQGDGSKKTVLTINLVDGSMTGGKLTVKSGDVVNFAFADAITDNSLKKFGISGGVLDLEGKVTLSGSGVVSLDLGTEKASIGKTSTDSAFVISGGATLKTDLASAKTLASKANTEVAGNSTLDLGASTLDLTDTNGLKLAGTADTATNQIKLTDGTSAVKANEIILGEDLTGKLVGNTLKVTADDGTAVELENAVLSASKDLKINANTVLKNDLALGTDSIAEINGKKGFADLDDAAKIKALLAHTGTISKGVNSASALTVENDKSLTIDNGSWTNDVDLTIGNATGTKSGSLVIGKADTTNTAASLKFNAGSKLTLSSGNITVGNETPKQLLQATLDLSELEADNFVIGKDGNSKITADQKGTIILSEDIANKIVSAGNTKLTTLVKEGGTLKVNGDFEISSAKLTNTGTGTAGKIDLAGALQANELTISGLNATALNIKNGTFVAETIKLTGENTATTTATIGSGNYIANAGVDTTGKLADITLTDSATLQLGHIENGVALSEGGRANVNLNVSGSAAKGEILVSNGNWTGKDVTLTQSGDFVVGGDTLSDGSKSVASFNSTQGGLTIKDAKSTVTISKDSSATFAKFNQANGAVKVEGSLTLTGLESGTAKSGDLSYGVENAAGTITVDGTKAILTLGETAIKGIGFEGSGASTAIKYVDGLANKDPFANTVKLDNFGTLKLAFAKGTEFTTAQIAALRKEFVSNPDGNGYLDLSNAVITDAGVVQQEDGSYTITHDELKKIEDLNNVVIANLENATVTGIKQGNAVTGVVGNLQTEGSVSEITIAGATLNNGSKGFANNQSGTTVDLSVNGSGFLHLKNGGTANKITLVDGTAENITQLIVTDGANTIAKIEGKAGNTSLSLNGNAQAKVNESVKVGSINTQEGTSLDITTNLNTSNATTKSVIKGDLKVAGTSTFAGETELAGQNNVLGNVTFQKAATLSGKNNTLGVATFQDNAKITQGQTFASDIKLGNNAIDLVVGTDPTDALPNGASATLVTDKLTLNGGDLLIDPSYNVASSIVITDELSNADPANSKTDAGSLSGSVVALQNSIFAVGLDTSDKAAALASVKSELAPLFKANGALDKDNVGAVAYIAKKITLGATDQLAVDSSKSLAAFNNADQAYVTALADSDIFLGTNSALAVDGAAFGNGKAAITLQDGSQIYAGKDSKVILTGKDAMNADEKQLFGSAAKNLTLTGTGKLTVQTINGWFTTELTNTNLNQVLDLEIDHTKAVSDLAVVSEPVKDTLLSAAYGIHNYEQKLAKTADNSWTEDMAQDVLGVVAPSNITYDKAQDKFFENGKEIDAARLTELNVDVEDTQKYGVVYLEATNALLENILYSNGNAVDAETNARLAVFGGAPQAAIEAGASTYEAISARMGVGVSGVSAAANGQGGAIWVTPVYKSADADGFNADNKSYGADVKLYGLALGADIEVAPNFKVGGMFNVGSGDADGQGLGSNVSNDFDYYGLGLYAGYSMDAFSLVADVTYTAVDNDIEGNTDLGKVNASIDSTNLSVGVTGQYKLSLAGMDVTPHAGLRYSMIDMDDYATAYSQNDSDSINIFSLPVGVTIAKEYVTDTWTVKPSFDLTLTGNFGDDEVDATAKWNGYSNLSTTVKSEIMDNFTYGAAVGVSATSGNFGLGLGVNYTGSSNTDEFGVNANARYMF